MKVHCLLPVRDEADIIEQCLHQLLSWADTIFVFDTGSVDATWEIVLEHATKNKKIRPLQKDAVYFSETRLRGYMFNRARAEMKEGDWFLRVDADEFHLVPPQQFIKARLRPFETVVYHQYYNFELTEAEAALLYSNEAVLAERQLPIQERRRHYRISEYSEPRLCRYRPTMQWPATVSFPYNAGFVAKARLPILHYPNRDPLQMARRCKLRAAMLNDAENRLNWNGVTDMHWLQNDWRQFLVKKESAGLHVWPANTAFSEVSQTNHLAPFYKRFPLRVMHSFFLTFLDAKRPSFSNNEYPKKLSPETIETLQKALSEPAWAF